MPFDVEGSGRYAVMEGSTTSRIMAMPLVEEVTTSWWAHSSDPGALPSHRRITSWAYPEKQLPMRKAPMMMNLRSILVLLEIFGLILKSSFLL
jgi:hypothetical protein